jgi:CheY-like chemotaxis protein
MLRNSGADSKPIGGGSPRGHASAGPILLIDDEETILDVLLAVLRDDEGYAVWTAHSGHEALSMLPPNPPALVMMDATLPNERPEEVVRALRSVSGWERAALVICSAIPRIEEVAEELGADAYLAKPFDLEDLLAIARRFAGEPDVEGRP